MSTEVKLKDIPEGKNFLDGSIQCRMIGRHGANMHYQYKNFFGWQDAYMPDWHFVIQLEDDGTGTNERAIKSIGAVK